MRVLIVLQGNYGKRIIETVQKYMPVDWKLELYTFPDTLPLVDDDSLAGLVPEQLPEADLLLLLAEDPTVAELIPDMVELTCAKAVLAPVANRDWLPPGLANQIKRQLSRKGIAIATPLPFCMLEEGDSDDQFIKQFAHYFGKPQVKVEHQQGKILEVTVLKDAPCGNSRFVARKLAGVSTKDAYFKAGLLHHAHVCYATMVMDREFNDTLMHRSGLAMKDAVAKAIKKEGDGK